MSEPTANISSDGQWRLEWDHYEVDPLAWIDRVRIVNVTTAEAAVDLNHTLWDCQAAFIPGCNQVRLDVREVTGPVRLSVKIDLDCRLYWEESGEDFGRICWEETGEVEAVAGGVQAAPLAELQARLTAKAGQVPPAERSRATGPMWPRWALGGSPRATPPVPRVSDAPIAPPRGRPICALSCLAFTSADDGRSMIHAAVTTGDTAEPLLSTLGTRWDLHGQEALGAERVLHLHHADDPLMHKAVSIWPIGDASFGDIDQCRPAREIQAELARLDAAARAEPRGVGPASGYRPPPAMAIPAPRVVERYFKGEVDYQELPPVQRGPASGWTLETRAVEIAPHRWESEARLRHPHLARPALDLFDTGWVGDVRLEGDEWRFELTHGADERASIVLTARPGPDTARVNGVGSELPLPFVQMHLAAYALHGSIGAMRRALRAGPPAGPAPALSLALAEGPAALALEYWPAPEDLPQVLQPRIVNGAGRAELDLRGTPWTLRLHAPPGTPASAGAPGGVLLRLTRPVSDPAPEDCTATYRLLPAWRRLSRDGVAGAAPLSVLHGAAHTHRSAPVIDRRMSEAMALSIGLPVG